MAALGNSVASKRELWHYHWEANEVLSTGLSIDMAVGFFHTVLQLHFFDCKIMYRLKIEQNKGALLSRHFREKVPNNIFRQLYLLWKYVQND